MRENEGPRDDDLELEVRIAPVMTGGTSLAVWMGGATAELYRLLRSCVENPAAGDHTSAHYRSLLRLGHMRAVVDVVTGTSAGGLNGTLLAAAWHLDLPASDFSGIRDTWLDLGDLEKLLRSPREDDPPSLLKGDEYFGHEIRALLDRWRDRQAQPSRRTTVAPAQARPIDLVVTVTTINGDVESRTDDFGETLSERRHAHRLRFTKAQLAGDTWTEKLAIAARTSAGIPGVFEPSFLPVGEPDASRSRRPDFGPHATFRSSRWGVDGGLVVNLPLGEALDRIFDRPAGNQVRRVVLYVCPTPSTPVVPADEVEVEPTIRASLSTVVTAARAEGVSGDVDRLRQQNADVARQVGARRALARLAHQADPEQLASQLFETYRAQRTTSSVARMIAGVRQARQGRLPLPQADLEAALASARPAYLPVRFGEMEAAGEPWGWGIGSVEQSVSLALGLLARTQALPVTPDEPAEWRATLRSTKRLVHTARTAVRDIREADDRYWDTRFTTVPAAPATEEQLRAWARDAYAAWPGDTAGPAPLRRLLRAERLIARALLRAAPAVEGLARRNGARTPQQATAPVRTPIVERVRAQAQGVLDELRVVVPASLTDDPADATDDRIVAVVRRLLAVHVLQTLVLGTVIDREQSVELMQVSWNSPNLLDPNRSPADKLAGPELARLGAFLKRSWRANDWCWGRMDTAYRLAQLLLDPARYRQLGLTSATVVDTLATVVGADTAAALRDELTFLDDHALPVPRTLPRCTDAVAYVLQLGVAQEELAQVALAVAASSTAGANEPDYGEFRKAVEAARAKNPDRAVEAADAPGLVRQMRIGAETVGDELGYRLLNRTISSALGVVVNAATSPSAGLPVVGRVLRPLRAPLHGVNAIVRLVAGASPLARAATVALLAIAGAVVAFALVGRDVPAGLLVLAEVALIGAVVVALLRSGMARLALPFAVGAGVIGLALVGPDLAEVVWSEGPATARTDLAEGNVIALPDGAVVRVVRPVEDQELVEDVEIDGGRLELLVDGAVLEQDEPGESVAGWKTWGFLNEPVNVFSVVVVAGLALVGVGIGRSSRARRTRTAWIVGLTVAAVLVVLFAPDLFDLLLTGSPQPADDAGWKDRLVDLATDLHGFSLEVVLVVLVLTGVAIGSGWDLAVGRRFDRRRRSKPRPGAAPATGAGPQS
jgi:patatin-related protein